MQLHHLNCSSLHPYWPHIHNLVYCLLLETSASLQRLDQQSSSGKFSWRARKPATNSGV